jgi:tripartite-type tricarboxylate transporter receptor subunit TctC
MGRITANGLAARLGQAVVVENRSGASGVIGAEAVARANPDGYTVLLGGGSMTLNRLIRRNLPYDPDAGFAPIGLVGTAAIALFVNPQVPATDLASLREVMRNAQPPLRLASSGVGTTGHAVGEMVAQVFGAELDHVPYRGSGPVMNDLLVGRIQFYPNVLAPLLRYVRDGQLRVIALAGDRRSAVMPELPTAREQGFPDIMASNWYGLLATGGTPADRVARLHAALNETLADPEIRQRLGDAGLDVEPSPSPADFARHLEADRGRWAPVVQRANIQID